MSFKLNFPCTNNTAEYEAYLTGLAVAREMGIKHLRVIGDSNLVVCQAKGEFALKEPSLAPIEQWPKCWKIHLRTLISNTLKGLTIILLMH